MIEFAIALLAGVGMFAIVHSIAGVLWGVQEPDLAPPPYARDPLLSSPVPRGTVRVPGVPPPNPPSSYTTSNAGTEWTATEWTFTTPPDDPEPPLPPEPYGDPGPEFDDPGPWPPLGDEAEFGPDEFEDVPWYPPPPPPPPAEQRARVRDLLRRMEDEEWQHPDG